MDKELLKLIGAYVVALAILGIAGYLTITRGTVPAPWDKLLFAAAGFVFLGDAVRRTIIRRNNGGR